MAAGGSERGEKGKQWGGGKGGTVSVSVSASVCILTYPRVSTNVHERPRTSTLKKTSTFSLTSFWDYEKVGV